MQLDNLPQIIEKLQILQTRYKTLKEAKEPLSQWGVEEMHQIERNITDLSIRLAHYGKGSIQVIKGHMMVAGKRNPSITTSKPFQIVLVALTREEAMSYFENIVKKKLIIDETRAISIESIPTGVIIR